MQCEIKKLYETNNKRYLSEIIRIYKALDKYNWFIHSIQKSAVFVETELKYEALLQDTKAFYVTDIEGVDGLYKSILFEEKYVYINGDPPFQNVYLREMFTDEIKKICHCQNVSVGDGILTGMKMLTYSLTNGTAEKFGEYVYEIIVAVYDFMDKMNYTPTNESVDISCNTIIMWEKASKLCH